MALTGSVKGDKEKTVQLKLLFGIWVIWILLPGEI